VDRSPVGRGDIVKEQAVLSASLEDYLETIYNLEREKRVARAKDVATTLNVGKSSVTAALKALSEKGYLDYNPYQTIELTELGKKVARDVCRRHEVLHDFLANILGLDEEIATDNACKMEHAIKGEPLERLLRFVEFFSTCPRGQSVLKEFQVVVKDGFNPNRCEHCIESGRHKLSEMEHAVVKKVGLHTLVPGDKAIVMRIEGERRFHKRIVDMGVTRGALVEVERVAPLGDPMEIKVRGYHLSIRKDDASAIIVEQIHVNNGHKLEF
jgi:DtxR family Mn-dependent transcriptional regulator